MSGNLDLAVAGRAPLAFLNDTLSISGDRIDGVATFDVKLGGPTSAPRVNGTGRLENGSYFNRAAGLQLRGMQASIVADGPNIDVRSLQATTRNGGTISGSGRVAVNPGAGFPGEINFRANIHAVKEKERPLSAPLLFFVSGRCQSPCGRGQPWRARATISCASASIRRRWSGPRKLSA
ncbi:hypothetical protein ACIKTA_06450 [Hansschlegelia beijingensis]